MSVTELPLQYQTLHDEVQGWLDLEVSIQHALNTVAEKHELSVRTVCRAYYHIRNTIHPSPEPRITDNNDPGGTGVLINLDEARRRRRPKRMVKL